MRIAIAGFQHETNTFSPGQAGIEEFRMADSWPGLLQGSEVVERTRGMNLPIAGAVAAAKGVDLVPILWCAAEPSGPVTDDAFDWISGMILDGLTKADPLDGIYLDLHGAMVTASHDDGEGALLDLIREEFRDLPIGVSLDLHANISRRMIELADLVTVYRTYPHLDMADTGTRCMRRLCRRIGGQKLHSGFRQIPFLVPLHAQYTGMSPCEDLYGFVEQTETDDAYCEIAMGFTAADIHDCGPSVLAYAKTPEKAQELAIDLASRVVAARSRFDTNLLTTAEAIALAQDIEGPTVLADVQDNPGAGGTSDTTGLLHALIDAKAKGAILGILCDPEFVQRARNAGVGSTFDGELGAKAWRIGPPPVAGSYVVDALSDGNVTYTGEMYGGGIATLGPSCMVRLQHPGTDIRVVGSSIRVQCLDRALFTHFGVDPGDTQITCVKSTVHYRADFEPIAGSILNVATPGAFSCELSRADYRKLRPGVEVL